MLQDLFNGVLGAQFGAYLSFQPRFWTFVTLTWVQLPKWECTSKSLASIPCTLPHLWKCVSHLTTLSCLHGPLHSTSSHKPNVKVTTFCPTRGVNCNCTLKEDWIFGRKLLICFFSPPKKVENKSLMSLKAWVWICWLFEIEAIWHLVHFA
jgi:hypothetical protein